MARASLLMTAVSFIAGFVLIPNIASYLQLNLGYPRERLGMLYLLGGMASFFSVRLAGRLVDRLGSVPLATFGAIALAILQLCWFVVYVEAIPIPVFFVAFMVASSSRNVAYNVLTSKVPLPDERARFMSLQSAVQHMAAAGAAVLSAELLTEGPGGVLQGMPTVGMVAVVFTLAVPLTMVVVRRRLPRPERGETPEHLKTPPLAG